uniref:Secreted protein n=1 Tax=Romanomermis culicivorax TaxID=13658 RepID=A0A915K2J0_ROMCU
MSHGIHNTKRTLVALCMNCTLFFNSKFCNLCALVIAQIKRAYSTIRVKFSIDNAYEFKYLTIYQRYHPAKRTLFPTFDPILTAFSCSV